MPNAGDVETISPRFVRGLSTIATIRRKFAVSEFNLKKKHDGDKSFGNTSLMRQSLVNVTSQMFGSATINIPETPAPVLSNDEVVDAMLLFTGEKFKNRDLDSYGDHNMKKNEFLEVLANASIDLREHERKFIFKHFLAKDNDHIDFQSLLRALTAEYSLDFKIGEIVEILRADSSKWFLGRVIKGENPLQVEYLDMDINGKFRNSKKRHRAPALDSEDPYADEEYEYSDTTPEGKKGTNIELKNNKNDWIAIFLTIIFMIIIKAKRKEKRMLKRFARGLKDERCQYAEWILNPTYRMEALRFLANKTKYI